MSPLFALPIVLLLAALPSGPAFADSALLSGPAFADSALLSGPASAALGSAAVGASAVDPPAGGVAAVAVITPDCTTPHGAQDVNGDYVADILMGDPSATVSGHKTAGIVRLQYGVGVDSPAGGTATLAQGDPRVGGTAESGDHFGAVITVGLVDDDGCADVVVGAPGENLGAAKDAGVVHVIFGSTAGLGKGRPSLVLHGGSAGLPGGPVAGERFGSTLGVQAHFSESTEPRFVAVGVPRRDVDGIVDAGAVDVVTVAADATVSTARTITQSSLGVPSTSERGDRFGAALAGGFFVRGCRGIWCDDLMVGVPGENRGAGAIVALAKPGAGSPYTGSTLWTEDTVGVQGTSEAGDGFGSSLSHEVDGFTGEPALAVGAPGEDLGSAKDAGQIHLFHPNNGRMSAVEDTLISQNTPGVTGAAESGDRFGEKLFITEFYGQGFDRALVVGVPHEDVGSHKDAGMVAVFHIRSPDLGAFDQALNQNSPGIPGAVATGEHFGQSFGEVGDFDLLVGVPDDTHWTGGVVLRIPWIVVEQLKAPGKFVTTTLTRSGGSRLGAAIG